MSKPMGGITSGNDNGCKVITGEATDNERNDPDIAQRFHLNNSQATPVADLGGVPGVPWNPPFGWF